MAMASTEAEAEPGLRENNYNLFRQQTPYYSKLLMIFVFIFFKKKSENSEFHRLVRGKKLFKFSKQKFTIAWKS